MVSHIRIFVFEFLGHLNRDKIDIPRSRASYDVDSTLIIQAYGRLESEFGSLGLQVFPEDQDYSLKQTLLILQGLILLL